MTRLGSTLGTSSPSRTAFADYRTYGVPSIRSDLPGPRVRRVGDRTNYGDESNAYALTNPSLYSAKGVYEKDLLLPRPKSEVWCGEPR